VVDVDSKDCQGRTPLFEAALNGHDAVVELLLESGRADINSKDRGGTTPLDLAKERGHEAVVRLLQEGIR
jgi:ankyrin repeat protein